MVVYREVTLSEEKNTDKNWQMLGRFTYHNYKVVLEATQDEVDYRVRIWNGNFRNRNAEKRPKPEVLLYNDLRLARTQYEEAVIRLISRTSFTDVSIFMQQTATKFL
jgi:hypothetical protein